MKDASNKQNEGSSFAAFRGRWIERGLAERNLSDGAFRTLAGLAHHFLNREKRKIWAAQDTIAIRLGISVRTLQGHLAELQKRSLIRMQRQGRDRPNLYFPAFQDTQIAAPHDFDDAQDIADQKQELMRKLPSEDPQICVAKTRKNLRPNPLKEPLEEPFEGGGAPAPADYPLNRGSQEDAPSSAPGGAEGATAHSDFDDDQFERFSDQESPVELIRNGVPDWPIRAEPADWRRLLSWIGETYGPGALTKATAAKRAGTLTIEMILDLEERAADVA